MECRFVKYHGTGNDFILVDNRTGVYNDLRDAHVAGLCRRRFGVGADGLMLLQDDPEVDFCMRYFNADGGEASFCGNGARCISAFAHELGLFEESCFFRAADGLHEARRMENNLISIRMKDVAAIEEHPEGLFLDTGSPHLIIWTTDPQAIHAHEEGPRLRHHKNFKAYGGVNVNWVCPQPNREGRIGMRTFERGVEAETWSCGTGTVAAALAYHAYHGRSNSEKVLLELETPGGQLRVQALRGLDKRYTQIELIGPAERVFEGKSLLD